MKPTTLASHLRSLQAAFSWAVRKGLMATAPDVDMPKAAGGLDRSMRGRPITGEEFDRMLAKVREVRKVEPEKWERLLRGLWLSGLRLGEALQLSWDADAPICVNLAGKYPKLRILAAAQKSKRDGLLPIAPEFGEFLLNVPEAERVGLVFGIEGPTPGEPLDIQVGSRIVSKIGKRAKVVVSQDGGRLRLDKETGLKVAGPKFAGAHDLRRAFGTRWSKRVMPAVLKQLMRHASIETTMSFYVEHNADDVAADLWAGFGNIPGNSGPEKSLDGRLSQPVEGR
jgi:integrase